MKGAILHDYFAMRGGGENLCLTLAEELGTPVYAAFLDKGLVNDKTLESLNVHLLNAYQGVSPLQILSLINKWEKLDVGSDFDYAVFSGAYSPLACGKNFEAKSILYCHTPPRFVYDQRDFYLSSLPSWQRPLLSLLIKYFQPRYEKAIQRVDHIISNSVNIQQRITHYLGRESEVIYPPCEVEKFQWFGQEDYFLSTARLDSLKRIDLIVGAFKSLPNQRLVIASSGPELASLKRLAGSANNIHFTNWVSENVLRELVGKSRATIYIPIDEDFGISPVESMAAGKPVIGVAEGGLKETVLDGETGHLIKGKINVHKLIQAVEDMTAKRALGMRNDCEQRAQLFRPEVFLNKMRRVIGIE